MGFRGSAVKDLWPGALSLAGGEGSEGSRPSLFWGWQSAAVTSAEAVGAQTQTLQALSPDSLGLKRLNRYLG